ncbi:hypothetical protein [Rhodococcus sp. IEGM 1307]|uniref:phage tail protein n=1 Tax=Rhodococcus sp. IEGM 1307 TaxID=3047091 RepID=UPI0024B6B6AA|nr:hypothetical protein [Rhodococcus sp. IEGM 1307]MDI9978803.1 hypothetical protein [Rhodococcus sp. IEGM 1307]
MDGSGIAAATANEKAASASPATISDHEASPPAGAPRNKVEGTPEVADAHATSGEGHAETPGTGEPPATGDRAAGLRAVTSELTAVGSQEATHGTAGGAAQESQNAADVTPEQAQGEGKKQQVDTMSAQKTGTFDRAAFKTKLREKIRALQAEDSKNIKEGDKAGQLNADVKDTVAEGKKQAAGGIDAAAKQEPTPGTPQPGTTLPRPKIGESPEVDGTRAVPPPVPSENVTVGVQCQAIDEKMAAANVTPDQLAKANEPAFQQAADARTQAKTESAALPDKARANENAVLADATTDAATTTRAGLAGMHGTRAERLTASGAKQADGKTKHEETRKRISAQLSQIYTETKTAVDDRLKKLDDDVAKTFDEGASTAKSDFYIFIAANLLVYYVSGGWIADAFTGGDSKESIFKEGRDTYMKAMERVIDQVADVVEAGLNDIVELVKTGKAKLDAAVAAMDPAEQEVAREVETTIQGQFSELEKSVADKQQEIIDSIAQKYFAAQNEVDATISALRDPVGALIDLALESVSGVIDTILKMKELLLSALAKAQEAIDLIIADPIGFLSNLVAGIKQGVLNFVNNIGTHLKKGLLEWLFGALAGAGIQLPDKFDLSGLMSIVLQVLGLTWTNIRKRAVAILGENVVKALETASEVVTILITKGPAGLWEYVKEQAATLLETLKESIKSFVIESVVKAGLKWLLGLLNPASAFVKACMAIVDIVSFIIDRGQQILEFVNAVLDSVLAIAKGQIGVAAEAVEGALAKAVPVAIGFLASLAGLGNLSADIKKVIEKIQEPVNKMIDWLIKKSVSLVKSIAKAVGFGKDEKGDPSGQKRLDRGMAAAVSVVNKFSGKAVGELVLGPTLATIRVLYRLNRLELVKVGTNWAVVGEVNPKKTKLTSAKAMDPVQLREELVKRLKDPLMRRGPYALGLKIAPEISHEKWKPRVSHTTKKEREVFAKELLPFMTGPMRCHSCGKVITGGFVVDHIPPSYVLAKIPGEILADAGIHGEAARQTTNIHCKSCSNIQGAKTGAIKTAYERLNQATPKSAP